MPIPIRSTPTSTEYWDPVEKRSYSIPNRVETEAVDEGIAVRPEEPTVKNNVDFTSMTIQQLKEYAAAHNITVPAKVKKAELIELLNNV